MVATSAMFERQIAYAARHYRIVSLDEIRDACEGKHPLPFKACFITFDDGWQDNYTVAFPILRRMGVPATVFVTTDYIGTRKVFWFTSLMQSLLGNDGRILQQGDGREIGWPDDVAGELDRLVSLPRPLHPWQLDRLVEMLKRYPESAIDTMVSALRVRLGGFTDNTTAEPFFLTWDQLREMERGGVSVGSHTCTHKILTQISDAEATEELQRSRAKLEAELGHSVVSLAFPNGDYAPAHMDMSWNAGYRLFFISTRVHPGGPQGRVFPRPCVHDRVGRGPAGGFSPSLLELHLVGALDCIRRLKP
jgi:peptidoglycan/xylan/chitin deacetylase (PgdA/CDA1 family)